MRYIRLPAVHTCAGVRLQSGRSRHKRHLAVRQPRKVHLAVLAQKTVDREIDITADYCGFNFGDDWLVGMGMDDASAAPEGYRWIDEIWKIKR